MLRSELPGLAARRLKNYVRNENIVKHGAALRAAGGMCLALLDIVDQEAHPVTHRVLETTSRFTGAAAVTLETGAQFGDIFRDSGAPGHPPVATESSVANGIPSDAEVLQAIGLNELQLPASNTASL